MSKCFKYFIDRKLKKVPTDYSWQFGIGNDHAFQLLRTDVCEHVRSASRELGIKYLRFHGIFCDDMLVFQRLSDLGVFKVLPCADKIGEMSFGQVSAVLDNVLKCGMKPFLEISFMPKALASGNKTGLRYKNNITMPSDMDKWVAFVRKFIGFLLERYGKEEVESWYFEIWNEPDLPFFFAGTREDYFKLYAATARAVKETDGNIRVGGPATSACRWLEEFVEFCESEKVPYDFISTHHYPGDAFGNVLKDKDPLATIKTAARCAENGVDMGDCLTELFFDPKLYKTWKKGVFAEMDRKAKEIAGEKPLFISEWNSMAVYAAPIHDEKYSAAFAIKSVIDSQGLTDGFMFWCCSDVFEEMFHLCKPFHGSFGIISNDGIPKPNFHAFKMLSELYPEKLDLPVTNEEVEFATFVNGDKTQVLIYSQDFDTEKDEVYRAEIVFDAKASKVIKRVIDDKHCNPKAEWINLGKPNLLTREQVKYIKKKTKLKRQKQAFTLKGNNTFINLELRTNDVVMLEIE